VGQRIHHIVWLPSRSLFAETGVLAPAWFKRASKSSRMDVTSRRSPKGPTSTSFCPRSGRNREFLFSRACGARQVETRRWPHGGSAAPKNILASRSSPILRSPVDGISRRDSRRGPGKAYGPEARFSWRPRACLRDATEVLDSSCGEASLSREGTKTLATALRHRVLSVDGSAVHWRARSLFMRVCERAVDEVVGFRACRGRRGGEGGRYDVDRG